MSSINQGSEAVSLHTGAIINGVQTQAEVLMERHTPKDWPVATVALAKWEALCSQLKVQDHTLPIQSIFMNPVTGGLYNVQKRSAGNAEPSGVYPTRTALQHLVTFTKDSPGQAVDNLEFYKPHVRAQMLRQLLEGTPNRSIVMRTAVSPQSNQLVVRALASELHSQGNGDDMALIQQLRRLPDDVMRIARMRVIKEWDYTHVELVIPNKVREVKPGVVIQSRINIENSETKGGSFEASVGTINLKCINGMVGQGAGSTVTVKHMGDIRTKMRASVTTVVELAEIYLEEYHNAYKADLPISQADAIARTVKRFKLPEATGAALGTLWNVDGEQGAGHTVAGLANAMTRYAQSLPVEKALELERLAGKVVADGREAFL